MNITKIEINGYKNLRVNLEHHAKVISLIGNNGSGKSNLLEALSSIFKNLYFGHKTTFDYHIEYTINNQHVSIYQSNAKLAFSANDTPITNISDYLPKKVVAIYSGEANRLWEDSYKDSYDKVIAGINNNAQVEMPKMLLINKYYWHLSLLTLLLSDSPDNKDFLENVLGIETINDINIVVNPSKYKHYKNNPVLELARIIEHKNKYTLDELKEILLTKYSSNDIYNYLYLLFTPKSNKVIEDITIKFNDHLTINSLSEGEKKLLLLKSAFEFAVQEDSLFLLDEPDAHIHINNKQHIIKLIEPFKHNRQVVLTTHSPTVTKSINNDELFMMDNGEIISKKEQEIIDHLTGDFWNRHQQSTFLSSDKSIILLVEGRHDKTHITNAFNKLKDDFPDLEFDIFSLGGENKIKPFMTGLYEAGVWGDKLYIAIYDNDKAGEKSFEKDFEQVNNKDYRKLKSDIKDHKNFFAVKLIKPKDFLEDCTIESLYPPEKYHNAYKSVIGNIDQFRNKSIISINKDIKDNSKNLLAEQSSEFEKEDFINFAPLFNLIKNIHEDQFSNFSEVANISDSNENISNETSIDVDTTTSVVNSTIEVFYKEAKGNYHPSTHTLILKAGSKIRKDYIPSFSQGEVDAREALMQQIGIEDTGEYYETQKDYEFNTPSGAAKFVMNRNVNGKQAWKDNEGKSISDLLQE